jgi:hypothetical protein
MVVGFTQPLKEMSIRNLPEGVERSLHVRLTMSLNLLGGRGLDVAKSYGPFTAVRVYTPRKFLP